MLPELIAAAIREVGEANGGALLLDAGSGRAILTDAAHAFDLCKNLRRAGFTRFVDFTGMHNGGDGFTLYLTLRAPEHAHARLTVKWKWTQANTHAPCNNAERGAGQPGDEPEAGPVPQSIHPSLSTIWPAAAVAEREVFEMLGIPFAGNALEPLLLDEAFVGHPLRREFEVQQQASYVEKLLAQRHAEGLIGALEQATVGTQLAASVHSAFATTDAASSVPTGPEEASHD